MLLPTEQKKIKPDDGLLCVDCGVIIMPNKKFNLSTIYFLHNMPSRDLLDKANKRFTFV